MTETEDQHVDAVLRDWGAEQRAAASEPRVPYDRLARSGPSRRWVAAVAAAAVVAGIAIGIAVTRPDTPNHSNTGRPQTSSIFVGPITKPYSLEGGSIRLTVPGPDDKPGVGWRTAYRVCDHGGGGVCSSHAKPSIALAIVTSRSANLVSGRLTYVLTWNAEPCLPSGPPGRTGVPRIQHCTLIDFVDAQNGAFLFATDGPSIVDR